MDSIITLEDVIEKVLQLNLFDEHDNYVDNDICDPMIPYGVI